MNKIVAVTLALALVSVAPVRADAASPLVFSLKTADIGKVVVMIFKEPKLRTLCEVTFSKEKQSELAQLATQSGGKPVTVMLNGKAVTEISFVPGKTGHSLKFPCASPDEAFATAKVLLAPAP